MLKIAICDDNTVQLDIIQKELKKNINNEIPYSVDTFDNDKSFNNMLLSGTCPYDIIFMDINLGNSSASGIDLIHKVNFLNPSCQVIYISQYLEFASDVYDTQHTYFMNKERLSELLGKALHAALHNLSCSDGTSCLYLKTRKKQCKIPLNEIIYMERNLRETIVITRTEKFCTSEKIDQLLERLPSYFIPCHRSFAINLKLVSSIQQYSVSFPNGKTVPIGRTHYSDIKKAFALLNTYTS